MSNPVLNENTFDNRENVYVDAGNVMTLNGTVGKSLFLTCLTFIASLITWKYLALGNLALVQVLMLIGCLAGLILALIISFKPTTAPALSPIYATCEGLALGAISAMFESQYAGIVGQAILGTFATLLTMLALYVGKVITVSDKFRSVIMIATLSIAAIYLISFVLSLFGVNIAFLHDSSPLSIGISLVVIVIAALNFLIDFDNIERGINAFAPKYFEWYCAFGLLVTLVWLYLEILKLLAKLNRK